MWSYVKGAVGIAGESGNEEGTATAPSAVEEKPESDPSTEADPIDEDNVTVEQDDSKMPAPAVQEDTPLLASRDGLMKDEEGTTTMVNNKSTGTSSMSWFTWCLCLIILVLVVIIVFLLPTNYAYRSWYDNIHAPPKMEGVMYRPTCTVYGKPSVRVRQTSFGAPTEHWAEQPCVQDSPPWFASGEAVVVPEYGVPDARLKVDLAKVAHPNREPIMGFGGAFTEASGRNYDSLNQQGKDGVMELLFGKDGLGYR